MSHVIIYQNEEGGVAMISPSDEVLKLYTINQAAQRYVPAGRPYKIADASEIPSDSTFRNAWEVDTTELVDGVGNASNTFK